MICSLGHNNHNRSCTSSRGMDGVHWVWLWIVSTVSFVKRLGLKKCTSSHKSSHHTLTLGRWPGHQSVGGRSRPASVCSVTLIGLLILLMNCSTCISVVENLLIIKFNSSFVVLYVLSLSQSPPLPFGKNSFESFQGFFRSSEYCF